MRFSFIPFALVLFSFGCGDSLDGFAERRQPPPDASAEVAPDASLAETEPLIEASPGTHVAFEPAATPSGVPPIVRIRLSLPEEASPNGAILVTGTLSKTQLRDISKGTISKTVGDRRLHSLIFRDPEDAHTIVAAPLSMLTPGETYTLAIAAPSASLTFVATESELPVLRRVWPLPKDAAASPAFAIFCAETSLAPVTNRPALAEPLGTLGIFRSGIGAETVAEPSCLRWDATEAFAPAGPLVLPPALELDDGSLVALDPTPLVGNGAAPPLEAFPCPHGELPLGPSCIAVDDDRLVVRPAYWSALFAVRGGDAFTRKVTLEGARFLLRPLSPMSESTIVAAAVDAAGRVTEAETIVTTAAPRAHLVISEVMAAPLGPEPAQEWIEVVNDGSEPADLADYRLDVAGAATSLSSVILSPGELVLIVSEAYVLNEGSDVPPASGTRLVRIPKLGKRGLSNEGQVIALLDEESAVVSRFPALPKPQKGVSVVRLRPDALDELPASFAYDPNGSSSPGADNSAP